MKKGLLSILLCILSFGSVSVINAQCYGTVKLDTVAGAKGSNTFDIYTTYCDELILITYDGWQGPGSGPVKVDGNSATHLATAFVYYYAVAETYAYIAPSSGTHTIVCTEAPYNSPYYLNFAASFYASGTGYPLTIASLTYNTATISCTTGGSITDTISTFIPNSMIYGNFDNNNGQVGPFTDKWTGATWLGQLHEGNGIDVSHADEPAPTAGVYTVTAGNNAGNGFGC